MKIMQFRVIGGVWGGAKNKCSAAKDAVILGCASCSGHWVRLPNKINVLEDQVVISGIINR